MTKRISTITALAATALLAANAQAGTPSKPAKSVKETVTESCITGEGKKNHTANKAGEEGSPAAYFAHAMRRSSWAWMRFGCVGMTRTLRP